MGSKSEVRVEQVTDAEDLARCFEIAAAAFGTQSADEIWMTFNPGWDTPDGKREGALRLRDRFSSAKVNNEGKLNTIFLKATIQNPDGSEVIAGTAIWLQCSTVPGYGDTPEADLAKAIDLDALYPGNPSTQRYLCQISKSLSSQRRETVQEAASRSPPAVLVMDLCCVDPAFQRRGIASKLVQLGLDEAARRGGLEAITEASLAGRAGYGKLGFKQEGPEIQYTVDDEFSSRVLPSNVFMRTGRPETSTA